MDARAQQRWAAGGGALAVVSAVVVAFFFSTAPRDAEGGSILAVLRGLGACGLVVLAAGAGELILRIEEDGSKGRPNPTLATVATVAGVLVAGMEMIAVLGHLITVSRLDELTSRATGSGADRSLGVLVALLAQIVSSFPAALFCAAVGRGLMGLGRGAAPVGLLGFVAGALMVLRSFAAYPSSQSNAEIRIRSVAFPPGGVLYLLFTASFLLFLTALSVLLWRRADPRELHGT